MVNSWIKENEAIEETKRKRDFWDYVSHEDTDTTLEIIGQMA